MKLSPKLITGILSTQNKGVIDWGWQGFVAYGCNNHVVVVDPKTVQVIQVLNRHKSSVVKVKWSRENYAHDLGSPYSLRLASADTSGNIIVWDVAQGEPKSECCDGNKPILGMEWLPWQDASRDLLVALHPPYAVILWNADTGTKLWKKTYTEALCSLALDPFCFRNVAFLGQDSIVFIDDFSITKTPSSNGKKFYISSPSAGNSKGESSMGSLERKQSTSKNLAKRMTRILVGEISNEGSQGKDLIALNECLQMLYLRSCRHHLLLVYPREVLILDLEINQTVGIIPADRTGSPFLEVLPMTQRDILYCLHENGSITCRVRRKQCLQGQMSPENKDAFDDTGQSASTEVTYDLRGQSDSIRMTRHCKVMGFGNCQVSETRLALLLSDSRLILWDLHTIDYQSDSKSSKSPLYTPGDDMILTNQTLCNKVIPYPRQALCDLIGQSSLISVDHETAMKGHGVVLKFLMTGLLQGLLSPITVIRMCPPLTTKNWNIYKPLLAVGSQHGSVQVVNMSSGQVEKEYSVHTSTVRGIEWASLASFMSFSYPKPGASGHVKNEIFLIDTVSGKATAVRTQRDQEPHIEMLRVSHLRQYFTLAFKEKPLELWDLKTLTILREMSSKLPLPTAMEWSPSHNLKALRKKLQQQSTQEPGVGLSGLSTGDTGAENSDSISVTSSDNAVSDPKTLGKISVKEHFVFTDSDGILYHFLVEGNSFTDASKIPPESGMGTITWLAWKGDFIVFADADGQICLWDLKAKQARNNSTHRGWIKKIRFAPGRGNYKFLLLYNEGADVWDINEGKPELLSSIKSPKEIPKIVDAEWVGSDRPLFATVDGSLHMMDLTLKKASFSIEELELAEDLTSPYLMSSKPMFLMKHLLQHQKWANMYTLSLSGLRDEDADVMAAVNKNLSLIDPDLTEYLKNCRFGTAERCLLTARLYGDESEVRFWTVALYYMRSGRAQPITKSSSCVFAKQDGGDVFLDPDNSKSYDLGDLEGQGLGSSSWTQHKDQPLERCFDFLCDNQSYKRYQLDRVALHDSKRVSVLHTRKCAESYIMLGQTDRAVQLLLETEPDSEGYYVDCLRSCLVASVRSSGASQSTIKLVATNLIAGGKLIEGVQLLCLIDKGLDGCRYLQTYGAWEMAVWLAKCTLEYTECCEVMKRWVDHLSNTHTNQKSTAVLVLLSLGYFHKVIEMLYGMRQFNRAACFIEAATEFGLLEKNEENSSLIEAVFLEYARQLSNLGHKQSAVYYCGLAGKKGEQLCQEIEILYA
ncbi:WD repeat-containing protein 11-like isoform X2 [Dreissena polymorpha]|nr:WD repeat-containing protein 11-like isoform X1 [Dreissena polymorpha]XP_052225391.1 WD repeat-containing protein 11-like isoform X2 [Dreissena polymorpha]